MANAVKALENMPTLSHLLQLRELMKENNSVSELSCMYKDVH